MTCEILREHFFYGTVGVTSETCLAISGHRPEVAGNRRPRVIPKRWERLAKALAAVCLAMLPAEMRDTLPLILRTGAAFGLPLYARR